MNLRTTISLLPTQTVADARGTRNFRLDGTPYSSGYGETLTDATVRLLPTPRASDGEKGGAEPAGLVGGSDAPVGGSPDWGQYEPAILRWEHYLGRPAPRPVDDRGRLAPEFPEWMMGYPTGHITGVPAAPGMTASQLRNARLKAAGNGVVIDQAEAALRLLLARAVPAATAA